MNDGCHILHESIVNDLVVHGDLHAEHLSELLAALVDLDRIDQIRGFFIGNGDLVGLVFRVTGEHILKIEAQRILAVPSPKLERFRSCREDRRRKASQEQKHCRQDRKNAYIIVLMYTFHRSLPLFRMQVKNPTADQ